MVMPASSGRYNTRHARTNNQPARSEDKEKTRKEH